MSKTGHSFIKSKLKETGAALAGEMSGHIFFNDRWFGFDDAIYAAGRVLEILSLENDDADVVFAEFPENPSTPEINIPVPESKKFALVEAMKSKAKFSDANIITIDGLRVELPDAWGSFAPPIRHPALSPASKDVPRLRSRPCSRVSAPCWPAWTAALKFLFDW